jgi:hypothetical protein
LAQIRLKGTKDELNEELLDYLVRGGESTKATLVSSLNELGLEILNEEQKKALIGTQKRHIVHIHILEETKIQCRKTSLLLFNQYA